jgi:hypothetical protein
MKYFKIAKATYLLLGLMIASACTELALEPHAGVSDDAYFKSIGDYQAGVVGVYNQMQGSAWYGRSIHLMSDIMGEDVKQTGSANRYQEFADFEGQVVTGHDYETALWTSVYAGINQLNRLINAEYDAPSGVAAELTQIKGEAHALRALAYFDLVKMYAQHYTFTAGASHPGVPIILVSDVTLLPSRNTVAEVFTQIISDFNTGISMMSMTRNGPFFMTKEAAQALLSRAYLYMEDYSNAVSMADAVINSGKFSLLSGSAYVNQFASGGSSEAIFELVNNDTDNPGSDSLGGMYRASGYGDYLPAKDLLDLIDPADIRWQMYKTDPNLTGIYASHRVNKWPTVTNVDNVPVIRLSEVYLNRAEAKAKLAQNAGAQADLNLIRQRGLATAPAVTATGQALIDQILIERRIELGYEGHSIHDLMRNKRDIVRDDVTGDVAFMGYPCDFCILPIPQPETDTNPNMTQNAGYSGG